MSRAGRNPLFVLYPFGRRRFGLQFTPGTASQALAMIQTADEPGFLSMVNYGAARAYRKEDVNGQEYFIAYPPAMRGGSNDRLYLYVPAPDTGMLVVDQRVSPFFGSFATVWLTGAYAAVVAGAIGDPIFALGALGFAVLGRVFVGAMRGMSPGGLVAWFEERGMHAERASVPSNLTW